MSDSELRSFRFRREREASWRRLDDMLVRIERADAQQLSPAEQRELPGLYRASLSSLSVARSIALDQALVDYLESLATRAYFVIYGPRASYAAAAAHFLRAGLPQAVRALWPGLLAAATTLVLGILTGWYLVAQHPEYFPAIVPSGLSQGRNFYTGTEQLRASLYPAGGIGTENLRDFALFLFHHNAAVTLFCFGLGFALGIPTLCLLFYNGAMLGAFIALFDSRGLGIDLLAWLTVHGTTELLAMMLASAAGLSLAHGMLFPADGESRLTSASRHGRRAGIVAAGSVLLLLMAALLEGFIRQIVQDPPARLAIGTVFAILWVLYFSLAGRQRHNG